MAFYNSINNPNSIVISFSQNPSNDFGVFAKGYFRAAQTLSIEFLNRPHNPDYAGYPIIFLYRHALELHLKNIVYKFARVSNLKDIPADGSRWGHDLKTLADKAVKILTKLYPDDSSLHAVCDQILDISTDFQDIDPKSNSFRYPTKDNEGNYSTRKNLIVNIEAVHITMSDLIQQLEILDFGANVETDLMEEDLEWLFDE